MKYITTATAHTVAKGADGLLIQNNLTLSGTLTLSAGGTTFAIITDPQVGEQYRYNGLRGKGAIVVEPSDACNITVSFLNRNV